MIGSHVSSPQLERLQAERLQYRLIFAFALLAHLPVALLRRCRPTGERPARSLVAEILARSGATASLALAG